MPTPSPLPDASATVRGALTTAAQEIGGHKLLQDGASVTGDGVTRELRPDIRLEDFGAVGDGVTDDYDAIMDALAASWASGLQVRLDAKIYATGTEIIIPQGKPTAIVGTRNIFNSSSIIRAIVPMRSVISFAQGPQIDRVIFDGYGYALCGIYLQNCSFGSFRTTAAINALRDGIYLAGEYDADHHCSTGATLEFLRYLRAGNVWVSAANRVPHAATATVVNGSAVVTFVGAIDLTTLDLDSGATAIFANGTVIERNNILTVDSALQLTLVSPVTIANASGCDFSLSNYTHAINDTNSFIDPSCSYNGQLFVTAGCTADYFVSLDRTIDVHTASVTSGSKIVTFSAGTDLYAMLLRRADGIRVGTGANERYSLIDTIDSPTQCTVLNDFDYTASGQDFCLASGEGYHETPSGDAGINSFAGTGQWRANASCHMGFHGLYGPKVDGQQMDYAGMYSIRVGGGTGGSPVLVPLFLRTYSEDSGSGKAYYLGSTQGCQIFAPTDLGGTAAANCDYQGTGNLTTGEYHGRNGIYALGDESFTSHIPSTNLFDPSLYGQVVMFGVELIAGATLSLAGTTTLRHNRHLLNAVSAPQDLIGTPTFYVGTPTAGTFCFVSVKVQGGASITLHDDDNLAGSKLKLSNPTVVLYSGDSLLLYSDGVYWYDVGRMAGRKPVVAATTLGAVVGKQAVYDKDGVVLGYVPIYDTIT